MAERYAERGGKILVSGGTWRWGGFFFDGILKINLYFCIKFVKLYIDLKTDSLAKVFLVSKDSLIRK